MDLKGRPHSVKLWQLSGTDYEPQRSLKQGMERRFSSWTPLTNKQSNLQLFEERVKLSLHWFDLWNDSQRKHLLHSLLMRSTKSQLKYCRDMLNETVPVTRADFTAVLPRFLSLYVMSFLSPMDLCSAAQVSWHWRYLTEQDCLWSGRCIKRGWFLPYAPREKEFGAWKYHYISCVSTLDWFPPREAAKIFGTLNQPSTGLTEDEEERSKERRVRQKIKEALQGEKRLSMMHRRPWGSNPKSEVFRSPQTERSFSDLTIRSLPSLCWPLKSPPISPKRGQLLDGAQVTSASRIPAYELVLSGLKAEVIVVLYDHRGTLSALLTQVERAVSGQQVRRIGLLVPGGTEEIYLVNDSILSERTLSSPDLMDFWEQLFALVAPGQQGGGIDIFCPLAASASGLTLIRNLSTLTGLVVRAPLGLATGSFQNSELLLPKRKDKQKQNSCCFWSWLMFLINVVLSEWSSGDGAAASVEQEQAAPALQYIFDDVVLNWCRQAEWMEEGLVRLRATLGLQLQQASVQARGRALGLFLWEQLSLDKLCVSRELSEALTEGLTTLTREKEWLAATKEDETSKKQLLCPQAEERVYQEPLMAAFNSSRPILGYNDIQIIFSPVTVIVQLNSLFKADLQTRLQHWGAEQCVGDVFVKFCSKLNIYTNYLNNYITTIRTIDKCREANPAFRAFLKRADRTLPTHMLSLQELLLCPVWRIQEYVTLLQALTSQTRPGHPDYSDLCSALNTMLQFRTFIQQLKGNSEAGRRLEETQKLIQGCPNLNEGNRHLIITQDAMLLKSPDEQIPDSLRTFEHICDVGLFLFNDALVLTRRKLEHTPFTVSHRSIHTFLASVATSSLTVREILHTPYVCHAFVLDGPHRSWVCAMEQEEEREYFLSVLRSAINSSLNEHH
ncbi:PREDICTED: epithelial cell-transforming sequence 2 oncogene-like [Cyprinodon variegatus]|uniref:epithelial cell-transforming sequence 2 oncogene-like n=1 Tax=Cyprinodon variegatus TaxID=28743 RepID=UPI00074293CD|nr:PREDICTED: epithelial cell-transforming sequence 2 oncogene-like [Cyprinodon variegatus]